jgi:integrase
VFYYQSYDELGRRLPGRSTGKSTKTAARAFCDALLAKGFLFNGEQVTKVPLFRDYAKGWWDFDTCEYVKSKGKRQGEFTPNYLHKARIILDKHLIPAFGSLQLNQITDGVINKWGPLKTSVFRGLPIINAIPARNCVAPRKNQPGFFEVPKWLDDLTDGGLKHTTAMTYLWVLSAMLQWAVEYHKYLKYNPCRNVEHLSDDTRKIEILRPDEVGALFPDDWSSVWDDPLSYLACKTAAYTGMRFGEVLGIRGEFIHRGYIHVAMQHTQFVYAVVKTKKPRYVTLPAGLEGELRRLAEGKGGRYLFEKGEGEAPIGHHRVQKNLREALAWIGVSLEEQRRRHLTFHGFRHFFNTYMLAGNVPDDKVMAMTGHHSKRTKERYTHFDPGMFGEVRALQEKLAEGSVETPPAENSGELPANVRLFRLPEKPEEEQQKKAN